MITPGDDRHDVDDSIRELALLADTAGAEVVDIIVPTIQRINVATFVGKGKVQELASRVKSNKADLVIFDDDLSNVQV